MRTGEVSPISLAVVWSEPSDGKGGPAMLLDSSARCEATLPRYHPEIDQWGDALGK